MKDEWRELLERQCNIQGRNNKISTAAYLISVDPEDAHVTIHGIPYSFHLGHSAIDTCVKSWKRLPTTSL
jgi:hypothetical protein